MKPKICTIARCVPYNSTTVDEVKCHSIPLLRYGILVSHEYYLSNVAPTFRLEYDDLLIERCEHLVKFYIFNQLCKKEILLKGKKTAFYILFNTCKLPIELIKEISLY